MNTHAAIPRPLKGGIAGFLALIGLIAALALAHGLGLMGEAAEKRAVGFTIGLMLVVIGNLLPKLRPLSASRADPARAAGGERFAGQVLLLAGLAYLALFAFAPLAQARSVSAVIGLAALALVALDWIWLARGAFSRSRRMQKTSASERVRLTAQLVFASFFVLATACAKYLVGDQPWSATFDDWFLAVFWTLYAVLTAFLDRGRTGP